MIENALLNGIAEGIEFLMALGSILGLLGLIIGILGFLLLPKFKKDGMIIVIGISFILLMLCGLETGLKYFRIRI